jgi:2-dehydropantoate 2-reductase
MRIAIVGIGGIGGYLGTKLCTAYSESKKHEIIFIQRGEHYRKIKESGLTYIGKTETIIHPHHIFETTENAGMFDLVFMAVKSRDLEDATRAMSNNVTEHTIIIPLLNGVNNAKRIENINPKAKVLNGCIYVSAAIENPGTVRQLGGAGKLIIGPMNGKTESFEHIVTLLKDAGINAEFTADITRAVWEKYILISSWASISSKYKLPIGAILNNEAIRAELETMLEEAVKVATTLGVTLNNDIIKQCMDRYAILPYTNKTSMQLDIETGKKPEIDIMTKFIVDTAAKLAVDVPTYRNVLKALSKRK